MPSRSLSKDASTNRCQAGSTVYRTLPLQDRLTSDYPETRVAVMELIAKLEYWRDNCISSRANSPERRACIPHMPVPAEYSGVEVAYYEDIQG